MQVSGLDEWGAYPHNGRMSLILQCNPVRKKIRFEFDAAGRQLLLAKIEEALCGNEHVFGVMGAAPGKPTETSADWEAVEFYNIVCLPQAKAPLRVDSSVSISGGRKTLTHLRDKIKALPADSRSLELRITEACTHSHRKHPWLAWSIGALCSAPFLHLAGDRFFVFAFTGNDLCGLQMWCYLATALAVLPMPWLIGLRTGMSARINTGFGVVALVPLVVLLLGFFGSPCAHIAMPGLLYYALLGSAAALILLAALLPLRLQGRCGTPEAEKSRLKWVESLGLRLLGGLVLFALLMFASAIYAIDFCYERIEHWYDYPFYIPMIAAYVLPVGVLAGVLRPGVWQRACYWLLTCTLLPGLVMAAPCYYLSTPILGVNEPLYRLLAGCLPLVLALCIFPFLKRKLAS